MAGTPVVIRTRGLEKRYPVEGADDKVAVRSLAAPPDRQPGRIVGQGADAVPELVRLLREEAKVL